jgi:ribose 5-phosphate isomerase B
MLYIGSDHGGFRLKESLKKFLKKEGVKFTDLGAKRLQPKDDYVDYAALAAKKVSKNPKRDTALLLCRSGQGMAIVANKLKNVRASLVWNTAEAKMARRDDMANVLCLPADYISPRMAERIVDVWLETPYSTEERHIRRVKKISQLEKGK